MDQETAKGASVSVAPVNGAVVEGLFVRALKADGAFADELRTVGIDVRRLQGEYPATAYRQGLAVAAKHVCPGLSEPDAHRELGRRFTDGFLNTILGAVMGGALSVLGPDLVMKRIPKALALNRGNVQAEAIKEGDKAWRLKSSNPGSLPYFIAGALEVFFRRIKVEPTIQVMSARDDGFEMRITWK